MTIDVEIEGRVRAVSIEPVGAPTGADLRVCAADARRAGAVADLKVCATDVRRAGLKDRRLVPPKPTGEGGSLGGGGQACRRFRVTVDDITRLVEVTAANGTGISLLVQSESSTDDAVRASVDALVAETGAPGELAIQVAHATVAARVFSNGRGWGARRHVGAAETAVPGTQQLRAPMPGKVARILVSPGDVVKPRQALVVVEAMKMENELRAAGTAHVKDVLVSVGTLVEAGRVLVVLEG